MQEGPKLRTMGPGGVGSSSTTTTSSPHTWNADALPTTPVVAFASSSSGAGCGADGRRPLVLLALSSEAPVVEAAAAAAEEEEEEEERGCGGGRSGGDAAAAAAAAPVVPSSLTSSCAAATRVAGLRMPASAGGSGGGGGGNDGLSVRRPSLRGVPAAAGSGSSSSSSGGGGDVAQAASASLLVEGAVRDGAAPETGGVGGKAPTLCACDECPRLRRALAEREAAVRRLEEENAALVAERERVAQQAVARVRSARTRPALSWTVGAGLTPATPLSPHGAPLPQPTSPSAHRRGPW